MATLTVYPNADEETTSVDGAIINLDGGTAWATLRSQDGDLAYDAVADYAIAVIQADDLTDKWKNLTRSIFLFDTSALPDDCSISSAIFSIYGKAKTNTLGLSGTDFKINVYASTPTSNIGLVGGDFDEIGSTAFCATPITYDDFSIIGYNAFTLNAIGLVAISKTGITKLGIREVTFDADGGTPTWASGENYTSLEAYFAEAATESLRPKLVITYGVGVAPTVTTQACTDIAPQSLTGNGVVTDLGSTTVTQHGHCWSTSQNPTTDDTKTTLGTAYQTGHFTSAITGLMAGATYYFKAYATNTTGTVYGSQVSNTMATAIGRRYWWVEGRDFHWFGQDGVEYIAPGIGVASPDIPWPF